MRHQHQRGAEFGIERGHQLDHRGTVGGVEIAGRLIGEEDLRSGGEGTRHCHPLLLATGELTGIVVTACAEPDTREQGIGAGTGIVGAGEFERNLHVLAGSESRDQLERLKDEADLLAAKAGAVVLAERAEVGAVEDDPAAGGAVEAREQAEQGGLAAARGTDNGEEVAIIKMEVDILEDRQGAIARGVFVAKGFTGEHAQLPRGQDLVTTRGFQAWYRLCWLAGSLAACGGDPGERAESTTPKNSDVGTSTAAAPPAVEVGTILLVGTSLTAGLGLDPADAWSSGIQSRIDSAGLPFRVVNAGVSGETSAGALRRTDWLFGQGPIAVLIVETGANDGLRGLPVDTLRANLDAILTKAEALSPKPVLMVAAMEAPPNLGRQYADRFRAVFPEVAAAHGAVLLPFLLDGVAGVESLNQADGIHPSAAGARRVADNVWRVLGPVLADLKRAP